MILSLNGYGFLNSLLVVWNSLLVVLNSLLNSLLNALNLLLCEFTIGSDDISFARHIPRLLCALLCDLLCGKYLLRQPFLFKIMTRS